MIIVVSCRVIDKTSAMSTTPAANPYTASRIADLPDDQVAQSAVNLAAPDEITVIVRERPEFFLGVTTGRVGPPEREPPRPGGHCSRRRPGGPCRLAWRDRTRAPSPSRTSQNS